MTIPAGWTFEQQSNGEIVVHKNGIGCVAVSGDAESISSSILYALVLDLLAVSEPAASVPGDQPLNTSEQIHRMRQLMSSGLRQLIAVNQEHQALLSLLGDMFGDYKGNVDRFRKYGGWNAVMRERIAVGIFPLLPGVSGRLQPLPTSLGLR